MFAQIIRRPFVLIIAAALLLTAVAIVAVKPHEVRAQPKFPTQATTSRATTSQTTAPSFQTKNTVSSTNNSASSTNNSATTLVRPGKNSIRLTEKFANTIRIGALIARVENFDPEVITVTKVTGKNDRIRITAMKSGVTTMVLTDQNKQRYSIEVFVVGDVRHLQAYLNRFFPHSAVEAIPINDAVVLRGWVTQPEHITGMREIAERFYTNVINQMTVAGSQQVKLKVRVMEVNRSKIRKMGFDFTRAGATTTIRGVPERLVEAALTFTTLRNATTFTGIVEALKEENLLKILAEPEMVTTNGHPAELLSGGEFPIPVPQGNNQGTTIEWKKFGVELKAVPIILGRGRVRLELKPSVSQREFENAITLEGLLIPALKTRNVNTQVEMRFGETVVIAGLLLRNTEATTKKIPVLGELPWVGSFFRRVRHEESESELVIMVTPELVAAVDPAMMPKGGIGQFTESPSDRRLFIDGQIEVPKYGDRCLSCPTGLIGPSQLPTPVTTQYRRSTPQFAPRSAPSVPRNSSVQRSTQQRSTQQRWDQSRPRWQNGSSLNQQNTKQQNTQKRTTPRRTQTTQRPGLIAPTNYRQPSRTTTRTFQQPVRRSPWGR